MNAGGEREKQRRRTNHLTKIGNYIKCSLSFRLSFVHIYIYELIVRMGTLRYFMCVLRQSYCLINKHSYTHSSVVMKTNVFVNIIILEYVSAIEREYLF